MLLSLHPPKKKQLFQFGQTLYLVKTLMADLVLAMLPSAFCYMYSIYFETNNE